jgi:hypothetical protein
MHSPVGAAAGCDLLILFLKIKIKRSQPAAAPAGCTTSFLTADIGFPQWT